MREFVQAADAVAKTASKNEKVRIISELLQALRVSDAELAAQFLTGRAFAQSEERVTGVGGSALAGAIAEAAGKSSENLGSFYRKHGDLGDMAEAMLRGRNRDSDLPLAAVAGLFEQLSEARSQQQKASLLRGAFAAASPGDIKYIVKIVTGDLRIGSMESLVEEAIARAFGQKADAVRRANLLQGDIGETLRLASANRLQEAKVRLFHPLGFMLASPVETAEELFEEGASPALIVEEKYDGIRAQVHKDAQGKVRIFSRTRDEVTEFPELYAPLARLPGNSVILDGEILAWKDSRPLPFTELQKRLGRKRIDLWMQYDIPVRFLAFDVLFQNDELLLDCPLRDRKLRLQQILESQSGALAIAKTELCGSATEVQEAFRAALEAGHEGIVAKAADSPYSPGKRGRAWLKLKLPYATLDVVVTAAEYGHGKRHGVLSDVTFAVRDGERLLNIGKAYSGLTDQEIAGNTQFFLDTTLEDQGFRRIVQPQMVMEVAFNNIQRSKRHESGFALRFPRIVRIRRDKTVAEIDTLARVEELFAKQIQLQRATERDS
jgi:DNA ligase-1